MFCGGCTTTWHHRLVCAPRTNKLFGANWAWRKMNGEKIISKLKTLNTGSEPKEPEQDKRTNSYPKGDREIEYPVALDI